VKALLLHDGRSSRLHPRLASEAPDTAASMAGMQGRDTMVDQLRIAPDLTLPLEAVTQTFAVLAKRGDGLLDYKRGTLVLNFLDIERAHLVGLAMGGIVVVHFALTHPKRSFPGRRGRRPYILAPWSTCRVVPLGTRRTQ
jgi:hypothetical protein